MWPYQATRGWGIWSLAGQPCAKLQLHCFGRKGVWTLVQQHYPLSNGWGRAVEIRSFAQGKGNEFIEPYTMLSAFLYTLNALGSHPPNVQSGYFPNLCLCCFSTWNALLSWISLFQPSLKLKNHLLDHRILQPEGTSKLFRSMPHFISEETETIEGKILAQGHTVKYPHSWTAHSWGSGLPVQCSFFYTALRKHCLPPQVSALPLIMRLWTNLSASLISRFFNCGMKTLGQIIPKVLLGHRPSHFTVGPPQTFRSWPLLMMLRHPLKKLYQSLPTSFYRWIHRRINRRAPFFPPPQGPGMGLSTLHAVISFHH